MKYVLRIILVVAAIFTLSGCSSDSWNQMLNQLSKNSEVTTTIHTMEFANQQQFASDNLELKQLLTEVKKEKVEQPSSDKDFMIVVSGEEEYKLSIHENAIVLDDVVSYPLTGEIRSKFQLLYNDSIYGKNTNLLQHVRKDLDLDSFDSLEYYVDYSPERFELPLDVITSFLASVSGNKAKPSGMLMFRIDLSGSNRKVTISIHEKSMTLRNEMTEETYALSSDEYKHIQLLVETDYYNRNVIMDDLSGADLLAPEFLSIELQESYRRTHNMYRYFSLGTLSSNYMQGLTSCIEVKSDVYQGCFTRTNYEKFPTYQAFFDYLSELFSDELRDDLLSNGMYQNINGYLYVSSGNRGSDNSFRKQTFEIISKTNDCIQFDLIGHYTQDLFSDEIEDTIRYPIEIRKFDGKWKFTKFAIAY